MRGVRAKGSFKIYAQGPNERYFLNFSYLFLCILEVIKGAKLVGGPDFALGPPVENPGVVS